MIGKYQRYEASLVGICRLVMALIVYVTLIPAGFGQSNGNDEKQRPVGPIIHEIDAASTKAPPSRLSEDDPNLRSLDNIMARWSLSEKELVAMQAAVIRKGGSQLSWPYFLAEGRLNLAWQKQGLPIGSIEAGERKLLPLTADESLPDQMRMDYAERIQTLLRDSWNKKQQMPEALRKGYVRVMARILASSKNRELIHHAIEGCIIFGGDSPEANDAVLNAGQGADMDLRKWTVWRMGFGQIKYGVLKGPKRKEFVESVKKPGRAPMSGEIA